jgi:hypothetical protein
MPTTEYETRTDSVLAWKKAQKLGRFDPNAPSIEQQKILASEREVEERGKQDLVILNKYILVLLDSDGSPPRSKARLSPYGADRFENILEIPQDARPAVPQMMPNPGCCIP